MEKVWRVRLSYEIDTSLRRLRTDYVDLYRVHRWNYETLIEETLESAERSCSSRLGSLHRHFVHVAWQFQKAPCVSDLHGWACFVSMQNHSNGFTVKRSVKCSRFAERSILGYFLTVPWLQEGWCATGRQKTRSVPKPTRLKDEVR